MSDATDDVKSFGAFKKSSEPGSVVSFWEDIKVPQAPSLHILGTFSCDDTSL